MDTLPNTEIKEIWERIKKYINPTEIQATTREEFVSKLSYLMERTRAEGKGSMKTLVKKGFPERVSEIPEILQETIYFVSKPKAELIKAPESKELPPKIKKAKGNRLTIKTSKGSRTYLSKNLKITRFTFKNKPAYSVYNLKTKKRITWGLF